MMNRPTQTQAAVVILPLVGALIGALLVTILGGVGQPGQMMMWGWGSPYAMAYGAHAWIAVVLTPLVLLGALILAAVLVVRVRSAADQGTAGPETPQDILQRRCAAGEITPEEYEKMRRVLQP